MDKKKVALMMGGTKKNYQKIIYPTQGTELITNQEFTNNTTGWLTTDVSIDRVDSEVDPGANSGGSDKYCGKVAKTAASFTTRAYQSLAGSGAGKWYRMAAKLYSPSANSVASGALLSGINIIPSSGIYTILEDVWEFHIYTARGTNAVSLALQVRGNTSGDIAYFDSVSVKELTFTSCLAFPKVGAANSTVTAKATGSAGVPFGVVRNLDSISNPQNFIIGYVVNNQAFLEKCVSGTYTNLINATAITMVANGQIEIRNPAADTFQLWYNGVQVGTDKTVADAGIVSNTIFSQFSTGSEIVFSSFVVSPL